MYSEVPYIGLVISFKPSRVGYDVDLNRTACADYSPMASMCSTDGIIAYLVSVVKRVLKKIYRPSADLVVM